MAQLMEQQRGKEGWTLLLVTGSSVVTPKTKLRAGARISTSLKVPSVIMCFPPSFRKRNVESRNGLKVKMGMFG